MKIWLVSTLMALGMLVSTGCASIGLVVEDDGVSESRQGLHRSGQSCEDRCKERFHECRKSRTRGGGPGASACAHQKNDCERSCH